MPDERYRPPQRPSVNDFPLTSTIVTGKETILSYDLNYIFAIDIPDPATGLEAAKLKSAPGVRSRLYCTISFPVLWKMRSNSRPLLPVVSAVIAMLVPDKILSASDIRTSNLSVWLNVVFSAAQFTALPCMVLFRSCQMA